MAEGLVTLKLAHPISAAQAERLHVKDVKEYPTPLMEVELPVSDARILIGSGYAAGVDPNDPAAVQEALKPASSGKAAKSSS